MLLVFLSLLVQHTLPYIKQYVQVPAVSWSKIRLSSASKFSRLPTQDAEAVFYFIYVCKQLVLGFNFLLLFIITISHTMTCNGTLKRIPNNGWVTIRITVIYLEFSNFLFNKLNEVCIFSEQIAVNPAVKLPITRTSFRLISFNIDRNYDRIS